MTNSMDNSKKPEYGSTKNAVVLPPYTVSRNVMLQDNVNDLSEYERPDTKFVPVVRMAFKKFQLISFLLNIVPLLKWLPTYSVKKSLFGDVIAGITVAVMHIPQGMAYGLLAGVSPSAGLYMAIFPTIVYFVFGTSRHISVGTLSVISVMALKIVHKHSHPTIEYTTSVKGTDIEKTEHIIPAEFTPNEVVTALAFMCGIQMIILTILQLGKVASLLSESLVSGFTTGAAIQVFVTQLKDLFGVKIQRYDGAFQNIKTVYHVIQQLPSTNTHTLIISIVVIMFMVLMNELVKPRLSKICRFPVPAELLAVVGGTLASYLLDFGNNYSVNLVGNIPIGLPKPEMPPTNLLWKLGIDAIPTTIVSFSITVSMGMILAKKHKYEVRPNQELFAMGLSNLVGALFSCIPNGTSLSRSMIQSQTGGKTQIASVVSAALILIIVLWIAPLFEVLPRCVLAGIIVVALKGMYMQAADLRRFHQESILNSLTWVVTFTVVVCIDVDYGLAAGLCISLLAIYAKGFRSTNCELGNVPGTDLYVDLATHQRAEAVPGMRIYRHIGPINFAFSHSFKHSLYQTIHITAQTLRDGSVISNKTADAGIDGGAGGIEQDALLGMRTLIIDLSGVSNIDVAATKTIVEVQHEMEILNVITILTGPNDRVFNAIKQAERLKIGTFLVMPSIHDAVLYARAQH